MSVEFKTNSKGEICSLSISGKPYEFEIPFYVCSFKEHSFADPRCLELDNSSEASLKDGYYHKTLGDYPISYTIGEVHNGIMVRIRAESLPLEYNFGLVCPIHNLVEDFNTPLLNFGVDIPGQKTIEYPNIISKYDGGIAIFSAPPSYPSHFFVFQDGEENRLRITASRRFTSELQIKIKTTPRVKLKNKKSDNKWEIKKTPLSDSGVDVCNNLLHELERIDLSNGCDVTHLLDLCRSARHPSVLWEIDFVKPSSTLEKINRKIEGVIETIFDKMSVKPRGKYTADVNQIVAFQNIRSNLLAETGWPELGVEIIDKTMVEYFSQIDDTRKFNLLYSNAVAHLSVGDFKKSFAAYCLMYNMLKNMSMQEQYINSGLDSYVVLNNVYWYVIKHNRNFRLFLSDTMNMHESHLWKHKKVIFVERDKTYYAKAFGIGFYKAAVNNLGLPDFDA